MSTPGSVRQLEYYKIAEEDGWASGSIVGSYAGNPLDEYSVEIENEEATQEKMTGTIDDVYVDIASQMLRGGLVSQVWPTNVGLLLSMAGLPRQADGSLKSYVCDFYDKAKDEYLRHSGLMCDSWELSISGSDQKLKFSYEMIGKGESTISTFARPSLPSTAAFEFADATFLVGGVAEDYINEITITVSNNLLPSDAKDANRQIKWMDAGARTVEVAFTVATRKTGMAQHYRQLLRNRTRDLAIAVTFNYPGTGSPVDSFTITLPAITLLTANRTGGVKDIQHIECTGKARDVGSGAIIVSGV